MSRVIVLPSAGLVITTLASAGLFNTVPFRNRSVTLPASPMASQAKACCAWTVPVNP